MRVSKAIAILFGLILLSSKLTPQEMEVPVNVQYPIFLKILSFDRALSERVDGAIVLGIVFQGKNRESLNAKNKFVNSIKNSSIKNINKIPIRHVEIDIEKVDLNKSVTENKVNILYMTPLRAVNAESVYSFSRTKKIVTLTGVPKYVESGFAVGLELKKGKPSILINLLAAKAEGIDFSSRLLKLARVLL